MPNIGDKVTYYTHEASDNNHYSVDRLAFVVGVVDDNTVDLVVFPPGGPVFFERVSQYDPDMPVDQAGLNYWRPDGEAAPDFAEFNHLNDPRWQEMRRRQRKEMEECPPEDRSDLREVHKGEQEELDQELDARDAKLEGNTNA